MLKNKIAIITGASRGIGQAIAIALANEGVKVFAISKSQHSFQQQVKNIEPLVADVTMYDQVTEVVETILSKAGQVDILINNAGIEYFKLLTETSFEEYEQMLNTNLRGAFLFTRAVVPSMIVRHSGQILFINSISGLRGFAQDSVYCASKYGLAGFAESLDEELRPHGIRICSIFPGATDTNLSLNSWAPKEDPKRRYFLKAEDIANAAVYILNQPSHVAISQLVIRPTIETIYSDFLPINLAK
jgi:NADP-dependent 3-hydroxy acid dehydrogenase YdfG